MASSPIVDVRGVSRMKILTTAYGPWEINLPLPATDNLIGSTVTFEISKTLRGSPIQTLTVGITIVDANNIRIQGPALEEYDYYYKMVITPLTGNKYLFLDRIISTYG